MKRFIALMFGVAASASAFADFSPIGSSGETNHVTILNYMYGGSFSGVASSANNSSANFGAAVYTGSGASAGITLTRVEDFTGSATGVGDALHLLGVPPTASQRDQLWSDGVITRVSAKARFAGNPQQFGRYTGHTGGGSLSSQWIGIGGSVGTGLQDTTLASDLDLTGLDWRWGRRNGSTYHSSKVSDNDAEAGDDFVRDHLITYYVTGIDGRARWVLFWEDLNTAGADRDYNDLVIELIAVPVPGAALLGVLGLGVAGWAKRRMA